MSTATLLLRLAGPLQSWGDRSVANRRETAPEPTKSGVIGLLAAAQGRPRDAQIDDLVGLRLGVRVDQPGTLLRDYHTVSDYRGIPLPQAGVNAKGIQKATSPAKYTHVTHRFYLEDAVFLAAICGPADLVETLHQATRKPAFPLALGRRSCVPSQPLTLGLTDLDLDDALRRTPWQASPHARELYGRRHRHPTRIQVQATIEDPDGPDTRHDSPVSFDPHQRRFTARRIRHLTIPLSTGFQPGPNDPEPDTPHDPFALLGW